MPYVTELSDSNQLNPNNLFQGMADNIAYFRKKRDERVTALNDLKNNLEAKGIADKVTGTVDEDGRVSFDTSKEYAQSAGVAPGSKQSRSLADAMAYGVAKNADLTHRGTGVTQTVEDKTAESTKKAQELYAQVQPQTDETTQATEAAARNAAGMASDIANGTGLPHRTPDLPPPQNPAPLVNAVTDGVLKLRGEGQQAPIAAPIVPKNEEEAAILNATKNAVGKLEPSQQAPVQQIAPTQTAPAQTETPSTQAPGNKATVRTGSAQGASTNDSASAQVEHVTPGGSMKVTLPTSITTKTVDPTFVDDIQSSVRDLSLQAAFSQTLHQAAGAVDAGGMANHYNAMAKQRADDLENYAKLMSAAGTTQEMKTHEFEGKSNDKKTSARVARGEGTKVSNTSNVTGNKTDTGSKNNAGDGLTDIKLPSGTSLKYELKNNRGILLGGIVPYKDVQDMVHHMGIGTKESKQDLGNGVFRYTYRNPKTGDQFSITRSPDGIEYSDLTGDLGVGTLSSLTGNAMGVSKIGSSTGNTDDKKSENSANINNTIANTRNTQVQTIGKITESKKDKDK